MITIDNKLFSETHSLIIGEVAQAHDGSLGMAHAFIDAIASTGANAVKFQTHIADAESTHFESWRVKFSLQDKTRYDYWKRMEFTETQWYELKTHAIDKGLIFLSSPFSTDAVELLKRVGVPAWKIASGEMNNPELFESVMETGLPVLVSTGMSPISEIDSIVEKLRTRSIPFILLQCTSEYPCPPEKIGLNQIKLFKDRYNCAVGLSDHSGTIYPGLSAATLGVTVLEVHITLSREMFGPDVSASVTTEELSQLVKGVRFIERMRANPVNKDDITEEMIELRCLFTKSVVARSNLTKGTVLQKSHLTVKKPGTGVPASELPRFIGRRLCRDVKANELLKYDSLEPEDI